MLCDSHVHLRYEDNVLNMLGGNIANFLTYVTLVGMMPSLTHIAYIEWISLEKSYGTLSLIFLLIFYGCCFVKESFDFLFYDYHSALSLPSL